MAPENNSPTEPVVHPYGDKRRTVAEAVWFQALREEREGDEWDRHRAGSVVVAQEAVVEMPAELRAIGEKLRAQTAAKEAERRESRSLPPTPLLPIVIDDRARAENARDKLLNSAGRAKATHRPTRRRS